MEHTIDITVQIYPLRNSESSVQTVWEGKHNFITIDLTSNRCNGQYRKNILFIFQKILNIRIPLCITNLLYASHRYSSIAFINIKNPQERDKIVKDYFETVKQIKYKTLDDKAEGL